MRKMPGDSYSKTGDRTSTSSGTKSLLTHSQVGLIDRAWLQIVGYALFVRCLWTSASTVLARYLTSSLGYLYPSSTVPIMITTNFNKLIIVRS